MLQVARQNGPLAGIPVMLELEGKRKGILQKKKSDSGNVHSVFSSNELCLKNNRLSVMEDAYIQEEQLDDLHSIMEM
jgi:hypothetical protein